MMRPGTVGRLGRLGLVAAAVRGAFAPFSPASLFANGEQGLWYDIGDFDRYMSELGPNSVVNGDFSNGTTGWTVHPLNTVVGGRLEVRNTDLPFNTRARQGQPFDGAGWYRIRGSLENVSMQEYCTVQSRAVSDNALIAGGIASSFFPVGSHTFDFSFYASAAFYINVLTDITVSDGNRICFVDNIRCEKLTAINTATLFQDAAGTIPVTAVEQPVGRILDKSGRGNHASQATTTRRFLYRATPSRCQSDGVDDLHSVTFPVSLGSNCTVVRSDPVIGAVVQTGQTIGTSYSLTQSYCGFVIVNRALTTAELSGLTRYMDELAGVA